MAPEGTSDPTADEQRLAELGYKQELDRGWTQVHQLRDLVLDHLGPGRLLHDLLRGLEQRRADRHLDRLAGHRR